jgi:adenosylhomocysteine nucleosidase
MRILVTFAVQAEFAPWRKMRGFKRISSVPFELYDAAIGIHTVRVLLTGIGWECARRTANPAMNDIFDACISSGLSGGLKAEYRAGDILAFRTVGELKGERAFSCSDWLVCQTYEKGIKSAEKLITSKRLVVTAEEKRRMGSFGDAVDMESFRILAAAQGRGIPALAVRAISDTVDEDLPMDFSQHVSEHGQIAAGRLFGQLFFSPQVIPSMIRFGSRTRQVAAQLADVLDSFVSNLLPEPLAADSKEVAAR